jgi:predicted nucleic acid-binding protein
MSSPGRANCFDASALVKLYTDERGSDIVRNYFDSEPTKYATPFCFYEALNVLKVKWLYRNEISRDEYLDAAFRLTAWYDAMYCYIEDIEFVSPQTFVEAKRLVEQTGLDLSDAFQILSVKAGYYSGMTGGSSTILVTGDRGLASVARAEGLQVWYFLDEHAP